MIISLKDLVKLVGISLVCFCAVFVSTFFLNYYLDLIALEGLPPELNGLYDAQVAMAQFTSGISAGFLGVIAIVMLIFYIRLYINSHTAELGTLKAMGYSNFEIARKFWVFGASVLLGTAVGYGAGHAIMPFIYDAMTLNGLPKIDITYHVGLLFALVVGPSLLYTALSVLFAYLSLDRPVCELLRGKAEKFKPSDGKIKERTFKKDMLIKCITSKKLVAFFVAFGSFCFAGMIQVGFSMRDLSSESMALITLLIGVVLAVVPLFMSITTLVNANAENIAIMKAYGYSTWECALVVFGGYIPLAAAGFAVGTGYQVFLMTLMVNIFFKDVAGVAAYTFNVPVMFITLAAFIAFFAVVLGAYMIKMRGMTLKQTANE